MIPTALAVQEGLTTTEEFFELSGDVLQKTGRPGLGGAMREIVEVHESDVVLQILAGPGAGKTEALVWRVLYELLVRGTDPARVIVTTFTRKAAQELGLRIVERSDALLEAAFAADVPITDPHVHDLRIGTVHSLCDEIMTEFDEEHLSTGAQVIDELETKLRMLRARNWAFRNGKRQVLRETLDNEELTSLFRPPWLDNGGNRLQQVDLALTVLNQHVETWVPRCSSAGTPNGVETTHHAKGLTDDLQFIRKQWETRLDEAHVMDYVLLQERFMERQHNFVSEFDHVFVDEFQDTNPIQYAIHTGWVGYETTRLTVVGDDDQALYRWRGSDIACFANLEGDCEARGRPYRREVLEVNHRSTATIVDFTQAFREETVLASDSLPKTVRPPSGAPKGRPVRLLEGEWESLCKKVANEAASLGAGKLTKSGGDPPPTVALLMASTSEAGNAKPALEMREALEDAGLRVYNPRNKAAAGKGSPVQALMALISYLVDPVVKAPAGKDGRLVMVHASCNDPSKASYAPTAAPAFPMATNHASIQKRVRKAYANDLDTPGPELGEVLRYVDELRTRLLSTQETIRLTIAGLIPRLLAVPYFRGSGYTVDLFRQALFTQMLEANIAVTRQTTQSLDVPLDPRLDLDGKVVWGDQFWSLLSSFGQMIEGGGFDDLEVEAFAESAVSMLTFHQAKGLEFDHTYVALTGKDVDPAAALATALFSGETPKYKVDDGRPVTRDKEILRLSEADRAREIYVAITRPKTQLTILHAPRDERWAMALNEGLGRLFQGAPASRDGALRVRKWTE